MMADEARGVTFANPRDIRNVNDCFFYHTLDLPGVGLVEGQWDLRGRFDDYIGGVDLRGKSVLDVGTANGFLSYEAEKRGASEVVSFDLADATSQHLLPFKDSLYFTDHAKWCTVANDSYERWRNGYWMAHRLYGSKAKMFYGDIYDLPKDLGMFDVTIVASVLEHLRDQISAMGSVARLTKSTMIIVSSVMESEDRAALFVGDATKPENNYSWWVYTLGVYREVLSMLGFRIAALTKNWYRCPFMSEDQMRCTIVAHREATGAGAHGLAA